MVLDAVVHNRIAELRSALGDHAKNPTYIHTVPARGYAAINGSAVPASVAPALPQTRSPWLLGAPSPATAG